VSATSPTYQLALDRSRRRGRLYRVALYADAGGQLDLIAQYYDDEGELTRILRHAAELERTDPHSDKLPSEDAITRAILIDCGLDVP
jgi:hypothetical protein